MKKYHVLQRGFLPILILVGWAFIVTAQDSRGALGQEPDEKGCCSLDFSIPNSWKLDSGEGKILPSADGVQGAVLQVKGNGKGGNRWVLSGFPFKKVYKAAPQHLCMFRFKARSIDKASGSCMAGTLFSFNSFTISENWKSYSMIFPISERVNKDALRLILYNGKSTYQFAEAEILPVVASSGISGLARGEEYDAQTGTWSFQSHFDAEGGSWCPTLKDFKGVFNTNRWMFGEGSYLVYSFQAPENKFFNGGKLSVDIGYYTSGTLLAEFSTDGKDWKKFGEITKNISSKFEFPKVKTKRIWLRLIGGEKCGLQVNAFRVSANIQGESEDSGKSASLLENSDLVTDGVPRSDSILRGRNDFWEIVSGSSQIPIDLFASLEIPQDKIGSQIYEKTVSWKDKAGKAQKSTLRCRYYIKDYHREDYGFRLATSAEKEVGLWWADSTRKIWPGRKIPAKQDQIKEAKGLMLEAAANDHESVQLVLYPKHPSTVIRVQTGDFTSATGNKIGSDNIEIRQVYYHDVQVPSDKISALGFLPDALPPLRENIKIAARTNFPIWFTVNVPPKTAAGDYTAPISIVIKSDNDKTVKTLSVSMKLHVWNFELPVENTVETAFGFDPNLCWKYHKVTKNADKERLLDQYFQLLGRNRISVYNPMPLVSIQRKYIVDKEHPEKSYAVLDFTEFDKAFEAACQKYHFNRARLTLPGMGGGSSRNAMPTSARRPSSRPWARLTAERGSAKAARS